MTNNLDDFEQPDADVNGGPPKEGFRANLSHAWRTRPLFKLLVVMIVAAAVIGIGISLFSSPKPTERSNFVTPPGGPKQAAGGPATPYFIEQTKEAERDRQENAIKTGGSVLPTPIGQQSSLDEMTAEKNKKDPLVELRAQIDQQKLKISQIEQKNQAPAQPQAKPEPFDDSLAQAMQKQLQQLQASWDPRGIREVGGKNDEQEEERVKEIKEARDQIKNGMGGSGSNATATDAAGNKIFAKPVINAGTVSYAQLLTEANSDTPGPVLAQILSGPLKGARAIGNFKVEEDYLVLKFSLANLNNIDYSIDAYALDPDTTLPAMATEVDHRYFTRVLLPAAGGFMQGFGSALGQGNSSIVTNGDTTIIQQSGRSLQQGLFTGLGQAGQTLSQFFQNEANHTKVLVRVAAGTPMGLFFVKTVCTGQGCTLNTMVEDRTKNGNGNMYGNQNGMYQQGNMPYTQGYLPGYLGQNAYGTPGLNAGGMQQNNNYNNNNGTGVVGYTPSPTAPNNSSYDYSGNTSALQPNNNGINLVSPGLGTPVLNP